MSCAKYTVCEMCVARPPRVGRGACAAPTAVVCGSVRAPCRGALCVLTVCRRLAGTSRAAYISLPFTSLWKALEKKRAPCSLY